LSSWFALCVAIVLTLCPATADAQDQLARRAVTYADRQDKINAWTVGLAAGLLEGAPLRLATEMSRVVDDGENLHVLPIVTRGPTENLNSLLYLRGVDLAIINSDSLDEYNVAFPDIDKLQVPGFDPNWKTINLGTTVPGLSRFSAAQEWLDRQSRQGARKQ
jgi:hypothetical protein